MFTCICMVASYSDTDPFRFIPIMDPIDWRFEDQHIDPEIHTSLCSEHQTAIRIQNRVILCECLFLYYFLIYCCQYAYICYSYHFMRPFDYFTSMIIYITSLDISEHSP